MGEKISTSPPCVETTSRIVLGVEYSGLSFCGWQRQREDPSIQETLEIAIAGIGGSPVRVTAAGRTDTGVHATLQIVHFDPPAPRPQEAWTRGVNAKLPQGVTVLWAHNIAPTFHARYQAMSRQYTYVLLSRRVRPAVLQGHVGWTYADLRLDWMQEAAAYLLGEHDFSAFRTAECQAKTPIKTLQHLTIEERGDFFFFHLQANAFLHHMVRNIVASLLMVGQGKRSPRWLQEILQCRNRALAAPTFMPDGLYLTGIRYADHWGIPENYRPVPFLLDTALKAPLIP